MRMLLMNNMSRKIINLYSIKRLWSTKARKLLLFKNTIIDIIP